MRVSAERFSVPLVSWSLLILGYFVYSFTPLIGASTDLLLHLGLGIASVYVFGFCGFRLLRATTRRSRLEVCGSEISALEFGLGVGLVMVAVFLIGILGQYQRWVAYTFMAACLVGNHGDYWRELRSRWRERRSGSGPTVVLVLLILVGAMSFVQSMTPPTSHDALVYHLALPSRYIEQQAIHYVPGNVYGQFPQYVEMLYTLGMLLNGPELAKLYHWMFGVLSCVAAAALARSLHEHASRAVAAASFATIPSVVLIAGWAYVDLAVVFYALLTLLCFIHFWKGERTLWLALAAVFAGVSAGCKYTGGLEGLLLVVGVLVWGRLRRHRPARVVRATALVCGLVCVLAGPWWLKNYFYTGNPLFPFAYDLFGGLAWDAERSAAYVASLREWGGDKGWLATLLLPWRLTMDGMFAAPERFDGVIGCAFLIGAPLVLASLWRSPAPMRITAVAILAHVIVWASATRQIRLFLPTLGIASALLAAALPQLALAGWRLRVVRGSLVGAFAINVLIATVHFAHHWPLAVVLGQESRSHYLQREVPGGDYAVFDYIDRELPSESYVFFAALGNPGFLCKRAYYSDAVFENHTLKLFLASSSNPHDLLEKFSARGFTHVLFRVDLVLNSPGRTTDIPDLDQRKFAEFLNRYGRMVSTAAGTYLYELRDDGAMGGEGRED